MQLCYIFRVLMSQNNFLAFERYFMALLFQLTVHRQVNALLLNLSLKYAQGSGDHREREEKKNKRFTVTTDGARLSRFAINPLWLASMVEIKAVICLKWLNNVRRSVKQTPAALYIMHQRPAEGLPWKDNMTYPRERRREGRREGRRREQYSGRKKDSVWRQRRKWEGQPRGFNKSLSSTVHSCLREDGEGGGGHSRGPRGLFTLLPLICPWFSRETARATERDQPLCSRFVSECVVGNNGSGGGQRTAPETLRSDAHH